MNKKCGKKTGLIFLASVLLLANFCGCASAPRKGAVRSYTISGAAYFSLASLCDLNNVKWEYDLLARTAVLNKGAHKINIQAGGKTIFVDGSSRLLNEPVDIYRGALVVPAQFRQLLEALFSAPVASEAVSFYNIKKVIIDPGHGGKDPGALGRNGLHEKDIVLDIAVRLSRILREYGVQTVLTRSTDKFIPLEKRSALTENSQADIFISIHANANKSRSLSGFEVYCISPKVSDYKRALSSAQNSSLDLSKVSLASSSLSLKAILWDMIYTYNRGESIQLSTDICQAIGDSLDTRIIGVKNANYCVLRGACVPAILVEVGFISNSKEEQLLNSPGYRQKLAEGIKSGIQNYAKESSGLREGQVNYNNFAKVEERAR